MAINFPTPTAVGETFTDPSSGSVYVCTVVGPPATWVGSGSTTNLNGEYLRLDATNDPLSGDLDLQTNKLSAANADLEALNGGQLAGLRNLLINPTFSISQRGSVVSAIAASDSKNYGAADRWLITALAGENWGTQVSQVQDRFSCLFNNTGSPFDVVQYIEWGNCYHLAGKQVTFSFEAKAATAVTVVTQAQWVNPVNDAPLPGAGPTVTSTRNITTGWQKFEWTFTMPTGPSTPADAFLIGFADIPASASLELSNAQFEAGPVATPPERRSYGLELSLCQRYYQTGMTGAVSYNSSAAAVQRGFGSFATSMRSTPTVGMVVNTGSLTSPAPLVIDSRSGFQFGFAAASAGLDGTFYFEANAEL